MTATLELKPIPTGDADVGGTQAAPAAAPTVADTIRAAIAAGADAATLTRAYLKMRAAKADLEDQAKKKLAPIKDSMEQIENHFLAKMLEMGVDSLKNAEGTPYKTTKTSVTVADNSAFVDFVLTQALSGLPVSEEARNKIKQAMIESGQLALIEARASKTACEAYLEETHELPAGLTRRAEVAVNIKAS